MQPPEVPKLNDLTKRLGLQFEKVFGQIAITQRRGILHRSPLALHPDADQEVIDIIMCSEVRVLIRLDALLLTGSTLE